MIRILEIRNTGLFLINLMHQRKIPKIPSIRDERDILVCDVAKKVNIFNLTI